MESSLELTLKLQTNHIKTFNIESYIREVVLSQNTRPQYFYWDRMKGKITSKKKPLFVHMVVPGKNPKKDVILPEDLRESFKLALVNKRKEVIGTVDTYEDILNEVYTNNKYKDLDLLVYNTTAKQLVLANETKAGKANVLNINGQDIYTGINERLKMTIIDSIKSQAREYIQRIKLEKSQYPIIVVFELVDTVINRIGIRGQTDKLGQRWDLDNRLYPYEKAIMDCLTQMNVIVDDERMYVTGIFKVFSPLEGNSDINRCLKIHLFSDTREIILNNQYYSRVRPRKVKLLTQHEDEDKSISSSESPIQN